MVLVLVHLKGRLQLPARSSPNVWIAVHRDREASFSVDEAHDPPRVERTALISGFLLIVRAGRIVTAHAQTVRDGCDMNEYRRILGCSSI